MIRILLLSVFFSALATNSFAQADRANGEYILKLGGCVSCHKTPGDKEASLSGGHALKTPFGTFYVPNITPDHTTGIGGWSDEDFITAMTEGTAPDGSHYYPAFPYTSYAKMTRQDLLDLKAYLDSVPAIENNVPDHDLGFPFNMRFLMMGWKFLFFDNSAFEADPQKSAQWNRGAYIINGPSHCGECHSPRNIFGAVDEDNLFKGNPKGPENEKIPNMRPKWDKDDLKTALKIGMTPEGDFLGGSMGHVIAQTTSKLNNDDLDAVVTYISELD